MRRQIVRKLGHMASPVRNMDRRGEGDRVARDRSNLLVFGSGSIRPGEPLTRTAGCIRELIGRKVVAAEVRIVLLPDHPPVLGGPNLPATLWVDLPPGAGSFVQQHDLAC